MVGLTPFPPTGRGAKGWFCQRRCQALVMGTRWEVLGQSSWIF